ncbi:MAG: hypothetical protein KC931_18310 [Candidatus Omnitrophica bacterium]|nr:hypothetical protein [Candidatus Omnitrophota bacterium]
MRARLAKYTILLIASLTIASGAWAHDLPRPEAGKKIHVFLLAGQSNMEGRADGRRLTEDDRNRLAKAQERVQLAYNREPIKPLDVVKPHPSIEENYHRDRIFGPELFFGIAMSEVWPDEKFLFIKRTEGATTLLGCWNPEWTSEKAALMGEENDPKLYSDFVDYIQETLSGYNPDEYEIQAMLWVQGEGDSSNKIAAQQYGDNLRNLIEHVRKDVDVPNLPFLLFQVGKGEVVKGMKRTAQEVENVTLIPQSQDVDSTDFYPKMENGHTNYEGMKKLGERFAEVFLSDYGRKQD